MRPLTHYHPPSFILSLPCLLLSAALSSDSNSLPVRRLNPAPTPAFQHSIWNDPRSRPLSSSRGRKGLKCLHWWPMPSTASQKVQIEELPSADGHFDWTVQSGFDWLAIQ
ncbi:hypothetical protein DFH08DRAFT_840369 [Mycena albidolilacea]|uniref:Uncharacterized protein n=1 Tax=Mycena albidolilacea TaxID=1033008 RepID=A0AAD7F2R3_9AGAR|nr:hypothetical protein DFH08DRAFT_840369 [Mycena albidolilacea]